MSSLRTGAIGDSLIQTGPGVPTVRPGSDAEVSPPWRHSLLNTIHEQPRARARSRVLILRNQAFGRSKAGVAEPAVRAMVRG